MHITDFSKLISGAKYKAIPMYIKLGNTFQPAALISCLGHGYSICSLGGREGMQIYSLYINIFEHNIIYLPFLSFVVFFKFLNNLICCVTLILFQNVRVFLNECQINNEKNTKNNFRSYI